MNPFDIAIVVLIVLSALFAFARGFVKEALSVGAWIGAGLAALYTFPFSRPLAEKFLPKGMIADAAAALVVFIVALIVLSLLTSAIARRVKESSLSALDRTLGLMFGLVRGALLACLLYIGITWALPEASRPEWIRTARTVPLLASGAQALRALLPPSMRGRVDAAAAQTQQTLDQARTATDAMRALQVPKQNGPTQAPDSGSEKGYSEDQRRDLNRLFQQNSQ